MHVFHWQEVYLQPEAAIFHIILFVLVSNSYTLHNTKQILHGSCFSSNYNRPSIQFQSIS